ncbi:Homeobox protein OTX1 [Hypsizygus marmoreus]|uniref:Homeobox protein OTX1 n=1 Tax=Hypsizygus marmoreus TaxID=39966 RepID=A0A369JMS2_HYPMA|nr:Homeobox protein OTX1 [Hypsizygus marmoreus]
MSKSRSATPTPNTISTNIAPSSESTTSRPQSYEHTPSVSISEGHQQPFTLRPIHPHSLQPLSPETSRPASRPTHRAESPVEPPMAKRFRRESPGPRDRPEGQPSSPSSDSQDDLADTEMDDRLNQPSETLAPAVPPPKKKRTRTLTTPHQSAVLHALLAQSRFPTTAMREEVGRSIGLSARKVQIWFQNQRQKARRPRSESDTSRRRAPQYGPFPSGPGTPTVGSFPLAPEQGSSRMAQPPPSGGMSLSQLDQSAYSGYHSSEYSQGSLDSPTQLLGPGMPGSDLQADIPYRSHTHAAPIPGSSLDPHSFTPPFSASGQRFMRSPSPPRLYSRPPVSRPTTTSRLHDREFSRTLPPLVFHPTQSRPSVSAPGFYGVRSSDSRSGGISPLVRRSSPDVPFAHQPPEVASHPSLTLPPPFTLQPPPRWDTSTFPASLRPSDSLSWSYPGPLSASEGITASAPFSRDIGRTRVESGRHGRDSPQPEAGPSRRSGRYDPVRAAFIHTTPTEPSPSSPSQDAGDRPGREDDTEEAQADRPPFRP